LEYEAMTVEPGDIRTSLGRNLTYGLLDHLGKSIVTGGYAGKPFPTEAELSKQHGVSRSVTREAVKMLTTKRLLSARPRQGTIVEPATVWNLFELLREFNQLRIAIEPAAAALAARFADDQGLTAIRTGFDRMRIAETGEDDTLEADIAFHVAILKASSNPFFAQFSNVVATALRTSIRFTNRIQGRTADLAAHEAVLRAIEARDADQARVAMMFIIDEVMDLIVRSSP
jgi:DNA-binding FadR family transcriptional regulator